MKLTGQVVFRNSRITDEQRESRNGFRKTIGADEVDKKTRWRDELDQFDKNRNKRRKRGRPLPDNRMRMTVKV